MTTDKKIGRTKRAIAQKLPFTRDERLSPARGLFLILQLTWGFAPLHPRLYAIAALRGLNANSSQTCSEFPLVDSAEEGGSPLFCLFTPAPLTHQFSAKKSEPHEARLL
jgi:hypothetical protein